MDEPSRIRRPQRKNPHRTRQANLVLGGVAAGDPCQHRLGRVRKEIGERELNGKEIWVWRSIGEHNLRSFVDLSGASFAHEELQTTPCHDLQAIVKIMAWRPGGEELAT